MSMYRFAGVLKAVKVWSESSKYGRILQFVPDAEFCVSHKEGAITQKIVVFHPTGRWVNGMSFFYDECVAMKTECKDLFGMALGVHCELEIDDDSTGSLFDFSFEDAPSNLGCKSVKSIKVV